MARLLKMYNSSDLFNSIFNDSFFNFDFPKTNFSKLISTSSFPPTDILVNKETKTCTINVALAGINKEDISVGYEDGRIVLNVNREPRETSEYAFIQNGIRGISELKTSWCVDDKYYNVDNISVDYNNGMLTIGIPVREEIKTPKNKLLFGTPKAKEIEHTEE